MKGSIERSVNKTQPMMEKATFTILGGLFLGTFVLYIFKLPMKFTYFLIAGPTIFFIAIVTGRFKRFFQGLLIFVLPISYPHHFFPRPYLTGQRGIFLGPLDIILGVLFIIWFYELYVKRSENLRFFPKITVPAFSLMAITMISMIPAQDPYLSLFQAIGVLKVILLFLYVANHVRTKNDVYFIVVLLMLGLFLQSLIAMSQKWLGLSLGLHVFGEYQEVSTFTFTHEYFLTVARVGGTIGHPNHLAKYVELLIPLSLAFMFTNIRVRYKAASGLVFVCALIVMLITLSRGGWVCFSGSMILMFFLIFRAKLISMQTLLSIAVIAVIFISILLAFSSVITNRLFSDDYGSAYNRVPLNKVALNIISHYPFLGVGARNYWKVMYEFNPNLEEMSMNLVHNAYLLQAAEMGIPGLIIFLWLLGSVFQQGLRNIKRNLKTKDTYLISLNIGLLAGMSALWAHWLVDHAWVDGTVTLWVLFALVAASSNIGNRKVKMQSHSGRISMAQGT